MKSSHTSLPSLDEIKTKVTNSINNLSRALSSRFHRDSLSVIQRVITEGKLRIFVGTWNMHGKLPPEDLEPFIKRPKAVEDDPELDFHLLVIGTQECEKSIERSVIFPSKELWEKQLSNYLGARYTFVRSETMAAIHLAIFILSDLVSFVEDCQTGSIATGIGNVIGNKGGVGVGLLLKGTSFLFVNSHLTAHQRRVQERNNDYHRINNELPLRGFDANKKGRKCVSDRFDYSFWFGDLNYRINGTRKMIDNLLATNMTEVLLANDQLISERKKGNVFAGFEEASIAFAPTYKFDVIKNGVVQMDNDEPDEGNLESNTNINPGGDMSKQSESEPTSPVSPVRLDFDGAAKTIVRLQSVYDTSKKQRIQSWTDRILYKRSHGSDNKDLAPVNVASYNSCMEMNWSDHKPVYANFELDFNWKSSAPEEKRKMQFCKIL